MLASGAREVRRFLNITVSSIFPKVLEKNTSSSRIANYPRRSIWMPKFVKVQAKTETAAIFVVVISFSKKKKAEFEMFF